MSGNFILPEHDGRDSLLFKTEPRLPNILVSLTCLLFFCEAQPEIRLCFFIISINQCRPEKKNLKNFDIWLQTQFQFSVINEKYQSIFTWSRINRATVYNIKTRPNVAKTVMMRLSNNSPILPPIYIDTSTIIKRRIVSLLWSLENADIIPFYNSLLVIRDILKFPGGYNERQ